MQKNKAMYDQEMLQSTMFAILDSLFWGMIVGTGCLIMSYVLPLSEEGEGRDLGTNLVRIRSACYTIDSTSDDSTFHRITRT